MIKNFHEKISYLMSNEFFINSHKSVQAFFSLLFSELLTESDIFVMNTSDALIDLMKALFVISVEVSVFKFSILTSKISDKFLIILLFLSVMNFFKAFAAENQFKFAVCVVVAAGNKNSCRDIELKLRAQLEQQS